MWSSSNPVLNRNDAFEQFYGKSTAAEQSNVTTLQGVANKTALLVGIAAICGAIGYSLAGSFPSIIWISAIASLIVCLGVYFVVAGKPQMSPVLAPIYAVVEGVFLGALTALADNMLASRGLQAMGGVGLQAFIITTAVLVSMLVLYKAGIIKPTEKLKAMIFVATSGIMLAYLVSFVLSFFITGGLPLISFHSAATESSGMMAWLGLGINVFILGIAALWLVIDFDMIEQQVGAGAPKYMEWYCGFALLVTLAWIYFEAVKLVVRLAVIFGDRR